MSGSGIAYPDLAHQNLLLGISCHALSLSDGLMQRRRQNNKMAEVWVPGWLCGKELSTMAWITLCEQEITSGLKLLNLRGLMFFNRKLIYPNTLLHCTKGKRWGSVRLRFFLLSLLCLLSVWAKSPTISVRYLLLLTTHPHPNCPKGKLKELLIYLFYQEAKLSLKPLRKLPLTSHWPDWVTCCPLVISKGIEITMTI